MIGGAEISHAKVPITLFYPDSLQTLRADSVHHFRDVGIKVVNAIGKGAIIDSCKVLRGAGLNADSGRVGIILEKSAPMLVRSNLIDLLGYENDETPGVGIHILNTKSFCDQAPLVADSVQVIENLIKGPNRDLPPRNCVGLKMDWACGSGPRLVLVARNRIKEWNDLGVSAVQNSDVQFNCNSVDSTYRGLDFTRTSTVSPLEPGGRFRFNTFGPPFRPVDGFCFRTDDALKLELGPNSLDLGTNHLKVDGTKKFIIENDADSSDYLNAVQEKWFVGTGHTTIADSITNHIATDISDPARVNFLPLTTNSVVCSGVPSGTIPSREESGFEETGPPVPAGTQVPSITCLSRPRPSPAKALTEIPFGIAGSEATWASLRIYEVGGRLIRTLLNGMRNPGYYSETWNGEDEAGKHVSAGIYFVRFEAGDYRRTEKLIRLR